VLGREHVRRTSLSIVAVVLAAMVLGTGIPSSAGVGTRHESAVSTFARSRAEPEPQCAIKVRPKLVSVILRCRRDPGFARAVFVINVGDSDVIDVDPYFFAQDESECFYGAERAWTMTWRYRAATRSVKVIFEAAGLFRCRLEGFTLSINAERGTLTSPSL
jgi:hypothetical protein